MAAGDAHLLAEAQALLDHQHLLDDGEHERVALVAGRGRGLDEIALFYPLHVDVIAPERAEVELLGALLDLLGDDDAGALDDAPLDVELLGDDGDDQRAALQLDDIRPRGRGRGGQEVGAGVVRHASTWLQAPCRQ